MNDSHLHHENPKVAGTMLSVALTAGKMGTWSLDLKTGLFHFTEEFYNVFKTTTDEIGSNFMTIEDYAKTFIPADYQSIVEKEIHKAIHSTAKNYSAFLKHPVKFYDGTQGIIKVSFQVIRGEHGEVVYFTGVNQDITEEEQQLQLLQKQKNELSQANARIKTLIGHMSHDLRNPIANIKAISELLKDIDCENELHDLIEKESDRALKLISNVLSESVVATGKVVLDRTDANVYPLLENSAKRISRIYKRDLTLSEDKVCKHYNANIDTYRIEQVFDNLLSNAVKYSPDKSKVDILLSEGGVFRISNQIYNKELNHQKQLTGVKSSTGFGLEIIQNLLKSHGLDFKQIVQDGVYTFEFKF
jgi:signal transduction histidine kinase